MVGKIVLGLGLSGCSCHSILHSAVENSKSTSKMSIYKTFFRAVGRDARVLSRLDPLEKNLHTSP